MKCRIFLLLLLFGALFSPVPIFANVGSRRVCTSVKKLGLASCHAHILTDVHGNPLATKIPNGFHPNDLRTAYNISGKTKKQQTIAVIDAYDDPTIKKDLDTFSQQFSLPMLPDCADHLSVPCFKKINQRSTSSLPKVNLGWATEIALDVEAVHALCENCSILLVEADSPNMKNLLAAEDTAVSAGATVISNSWGGPEFPQETDFDTHFHHDGIAITVSSGDNGYGVQYPAASPFVTAVGGTSLFLTNGAYKNEIAWSGAGSGCSQYESKPTWQADTKCKNRTVTDVSAVADPATGMAIFTSTGVRGQKGWFVVGGTSLASPIIAAMYALSGNIPKGQRANSLPYILGSATNLHDVKSGSNGDCTTGYLCTARTHYDGPTGLGTPKGTGAF